MITELAPVDSITNLVDKGAVTVVGLGEVQVTRNPDTVLASYGLGSCVVVCVYDLEVHVGGMMHVLLPSSGSRPVSSGYPGKYADSGTVHLIRGLEGQGAVISRMTAKIAGGAAVTRGTMPDSLIDVGNKNVAAVKVALETEGIPIIAYDTGGFHGRSVWFWVKSGKVIVRTAKNVTIRL
ncbi:MAG TPA: chemotaxis protein CheD [Dehalococcoidia bacterium]|nr:chemotaxis protein CheD [Dehalococcoidia bacterium]